MKTNESSDRIFNLVIMAKEKKKLNKCLLIAMYMGFLSRCLSGYKGLAIQLVNITLKEMKMLSLGY